MLIKVCGMRDPDNIAAVSKLDIDLMGFIFWPHSKRYVENPDVGSCRSSLLKTGVFVNASFESIRDKASRFALDCIQLHGDEPPMTCQMLREEGLHVIKAFSIASSDDLLKTGPYEGHANYFLFDTPTAGRGGSGRRFDWSILSSYAGSTPFFLSGGLRPECIDELSRFHHKRLAGIDLNSGFEKEPGLKDAAMLEAFVNKVRRMITEQ